MKTKRGPYGQRMIKISVYFWTDNLPEGLDKKTAWNFGTIHLNSNKNKEIKSDNIMFNTKEEDDLLIRFNELLKRNNIKLIKRTGKYVETELN